MPDVTTLPDEELYRIAGIQPKVTTLTEAGNPADLSDDELYTIAGVDMPSTALQPLPAHRPARELTLPEKASETLATATEGARDIIQGIPEAAGSLVTGAAAFVPSLITGAGELLKQFMDTGKIDTSGLARARKAQEEVMGALTLQPKTKFGQTVTEVVASPFTGYQAGIQKVSEVAGATPEETARNQFIGDALLIFLPKLAKTLKGPVKSMYETTRRYAERQGKTPVDAQVEALNRIGNTQAGNPQVREALEGMVTELQQAETERFASANKEILKGKGEIPEKIPTEPPIQGPARRPSVNLMESKGETPEFEQALDLVAKNPDMTLNQARETIRGSAQEIETVAAEQARQAEADVIRRKAMELQEKWKPGSTELYKKPVPIEDIPDAELRKIARVEEAPKPPIGQKQYRVVLKDTPLEETPDHWTTNSLEDAQRIMARMEKGDGQPRKIVEINPQAVEQAGGAPQGKSPYGTGADWIRTETELTPKDIKGVVSTEDVTFKDKVSNVLSAFDTHPEQVKALAERLKANPQAVIEAKDKILRQGGPRTDFEREIVRQIASGEYNRFKEVVVSEQGKSATEAQAETGRRGQGGEVRVKEPWSEFKPNKQGYQARELPGLKEGYFVAQQSATEFHIIESERGSTKAIVKQNNKGKWQFWPETPIIGKDFQKFPQAIDKIFDTPQEAALAYNEFKDMIDKPQSVTLEQYKSFLNRENTHRNAVMAALERGEILKPEVLADYPDLQKTSAKKVGEILPEYNVRYEGQQEFPGRGSVPMYTDMETKSTFMVKSGENIGDVVGKVRESFKKTGPAPAREAVQRTGAPPAKPQADIISWIKKKGGINIKNDHWKGELRMVREEMNKGKKFGAGNAVVNSVSKHTLDQLALIAKDEGFLREGTPDELLQAIGEKRLRPEAYEEQGAREVAAEMKREERFIDPEFDLREGQKVIIKGEEYHKVGEDKQGRAILKDGETLKIPPGETIEVDKVLKPPKTVLSEPTKATEKGRKPSQAGLPMDTTSTALEGPLTAKETPETPLERATREAEGRKVEAEETKKQTKLYSGIHIPEAIRMFRETKAYESIAHTADKYLGTLSTRLENISPKIQQHTRDMIQETMQMTLKDSRTVKPFMDTVMKIKKASKEDYRDLSVAFFNGDRDAVVSIMKRHGDPGTYAIFRLWDDAKFNQMRREGISVGYLQEHGTRAVKDAQGLLNHYFEKIGKAEDAGLIQQALRQKEGELGRALSDVEKIEVVNLLLRGYTVSGIQLAKPGQLKARLIDKVTPEMLDFYYPTEEGIARYIGSVNEHIKAREFFGSTLPKKRQESYRQQRKASLGARLEELSAERERLNKEYDTKGLSEDARPAAWKAINEEITALRREQTALDKELSEEAYKAEYGDDINASIGAYVLDMVKEHKLDWKQQDELATVLQTYFGRDKTSKAISTIKELSYIDNMGSVVTAWNNLQDVAATMLRNGIINTGKGAADFFRKSNKVIAEELGLDAMLHEFKTKGLLNKALETIFKLEGFNATERFSTQVALNAGYRKYQALALKDVAQFKKDLEPYFGKEKTDLLLADLKAGKVKSDPVMKLMFKVISDQKPVSRLEHTEGYLKANTGKLFYQMKTYLIKQNLEYVRRDVARKFNEGDYKTGAKNLMKYALVMMAVGASADTIKDWLLGRSIRMADMVMDQFMKMSAVPRYTIWKFRQDPAEAVVTGSIALPRVFKSVSSDIQKIQKGKFTLRDAATIQDIPIVGKPFYWKFGGGQTKTLRYQRKNLLKDITENRRDRSEVMKDIQEFNRTVNKKKDRGIKPITYLSISLAIRAKGKENQNAR